MNGGKLQAINASLLPKLALLQKRPGASLLHGVQGQLSLSLSRKWKARDKPGICKGLGQGNEDMLPSTTRDLKLKKPWWDTEQSIDLSPTSKTRGAKASHTAKDINMR